MSSLSSSSGLISHPLTYDAVTCSCLDPDNCHCPREQEDNLSDDEDYPTPKPKTKRKPVYDLGTYIIYGLRSRTKRLREFAASQNLTQPHTIVEPPPRIVIEINSDDEYEEEYVFACFKCGGKAVLSSHVH